MALSNSIREYIQVQSTKLIFFSGRKCKIEYAIKLEICIFAQIACLKLLL